MNIFAKAVQFVKEAISELKKVTWLGKKEVVASTIVVIIVIIAVAIYVGTIDFILARVIHLFF
jgi:preprotein translocase subunit SecE